MAPPPSANLEGFTLSIGLGYGTPFGDIYRLDSTTSFAMSDGISGQIPFVLGAGYRVNPLFSFGGVFQYAVTSLKDGACSPGASCSASDTRIGIEGRLHFAADQMFSPWISGGFGYEWFSLSQSQGTASMDGTFKGLEFNFEAGGDFRTGPIFTLGPFVGLHVGTYDSASATDSSLGSTSRDIPSSQQTTHGWLAFGIRGAFTL
jgi:hypothetical protein